MAWSLINAGRPLRGRLPGARGRRSTAGCGRCGSGWDAYPGPTLDRGSIRDSIAWDPDVWELVEANSIGIPYFGGQIDPAPRGQAQEHRVRPRGVVLQHPQPRRPRPTTATTPAGAARRSASRSGSPTSSPPTAPRSCSPATTTTAPRCSARSSGAPTSRPPTAAATPAAAARPTAHGRRLDLRLRDASCPDFVSASQGIVGRVSDHPFVYAEAYVPEEPLGDVPPGTEPSPPATRPPTRTTESP